MMKRMAGFSFCLLTLFFWSCYEPVFDVPTKDNNYGIFEDGKTRVRFVNHNIFSVEIFSDDSRFHKIADVGPHSSSVAIETSPNQDGAVFYPTYRIVIDGISIPYDGEEIITRIDKGQNDVRVHLLSQLSADEKARSISDDTYIRVHNDSSYSLSLRQGSTELPVEGSTWSILNAYESGSFLIAPSSVADYSLMRNTTTALNFPKNITDFDSARIYVFRYVGGDSFDFQVRAITIGQALALIPRY